MDQGIRRFQKRIFKGVLLTEANINFSTKMYKICDVYTVLDSVAKMGAVVIALIVVVDAALVVVANVEGIVYYCSTFGIKDGLKMYRYLGISGLPNGVLSWIKMDEQEIEEAASKTVAKIGDDFGKAGTLVENPGTKVDWSLQTQHGMQRMAERGVTQEMVDSWVQNGKALVQGGGSKYLFFSPEGAAVVGIDGYLVTVIPESYYDDAYKALTKALFGK